MHRLASILIGGLLAFGCGAQMAGEDPAAAADGGDAASGLTPVQACQDYLKAWCAKQQECWPLSVLMNTGDVATCESTGLADCMSGFGARTPLTPSSLEACAQSYASLSCENVVNRLDRTTECKALRGTVQATAPCTTSWECQEGCCVQPKNALCPVCTPKIPVGGPCAQAFDCDYGLLCSDAGACAQPSGEGEACGPSQPCRTTMACLAGACATVGQLGASCDPQVGNCDSLHGLFCNSSTLRCEQMKFAKSGEPCGFVDGNAGTYTLCIDGSACAPANAVTGTCAGPLAVGQPCDPIAFPACESPSTCVEGQCALRAPSCP